MSACNTPPTASSAFVSASASPFLSPSIPSTPSAIKSPPQEEEEEEEEEEESKEKTDEEDDGGGGGGEDEEDIIPYTLTFRVQALGQTTVSTSTGASAASIPNLNPKPISKQNRQKNPNQILPTNQKSILNQSPLSLSTSLLSGQPRSCDVYIGIHGHSPSLSRFSKWLRAELELQGIACFSADRARFSDTLSHDIARRIISSCTFGVVIISKKSFQNPFTIEEILTFLQRKNLVPLFFDIAPSDCLARDIVERRGEVWEKEGGELWRLFDGNERDWTEALDGLARTEEWKLEAYNGMWRDCILKALSLLGTRLGRRSVAERERVRKERVEGEEFPFPRNASFVGRDRELAVLETMLFAKRDDDQEQRDHGEIKGQSGPCFWSRSSSRNSGFVSRRRSDAERWQRRRTQLHIDNSETPEHIVTRRKSDSDKTRDLVDDQFLPCLDPGSSSSGVSNQKKGGFSSWEAEIYSNKGNKLLPPRFRNSSSSSRHYRGSKHRQSRASPMEIRSLNGDLHCDVGGVGIACISGASGIGKTEMALEYAYRYSQRYRMVLWVGGEARYLRQNYLNLSLFLGLDVGTETQVGPGRGRVRTFDEHEMEAFQRVKRELQRDVPYLLVIDNLESERDWWDGREISELIPQPGGATHVIFTTRLPKVMNSISLELSYLSGVDALSLMKGRREFSSQELDALRIIEERLGRLTIGLGIVGTLLSELRIMPSDLLEKMDKSLLREWTWGAKEESTLRNNPSLVKLLGVCFSFLDKKEGLNKSSPLKMALVGGWFAPFPIPIPLLALAALKYPSSSEGIKSLRGMVSSWFCCVAPTHVKRKEVESGLLLLRYGIARRCTRQGWVHFHEIVQLYARKRGGLDAAKAMVQGVRKRGAISLHSEHFWAACFLVLGFGNDPIMVELKVVEMLSFIRRGVLQLAIRSFTSFSRCYAALEFLRLCTNLLEDVEKSFVSQVDKSLCCPRKSNSNGDHVDEYVWQDVTLLKALLLETRAKLMLKGGHFDAAEELCRTCISIRTVMLGQEHPDTLAAHEILGKLVRCRTSS